MGHRTVVMLNNDLAHVWSKDENLGQLIVQGMSDVQEHYRSNPLGSYGKVVQCTHADVQSLVVLEHYGSFEEVAVSSWWQGQKKEDVKLNLLKQMAEEMGYKVVKIKGED